jgi:hypothetical protein
MGMTTATPIGRVIAPEIRDAIQGAAKRTGISFDFLVRQAEIESGLDPRAKASTSSATGLYQFIESTWLRMIRQHGAKYGHAEAAQAISPTGAPRVGDPAMRARILELRKDPALSAAMAAEYTRSNQDQLRLALRREPTANELYMAHFLGPQSASRFLQAWASDRTAVAADVVPDAAGPNRRVFFAPDGRPRSVEEVLSRFAQRFQGTQTGAPPAPEIVRAVARTERGHAKDAAVLTAAAQTRVQVMQGLSSNAGVSPVTVAALASLDDSKGRTVAGRLARQGMP